MKNETFFHREVLHLHNNSLFAEILLTLYINMMIFINKSKINISIKIRNGNGRRCE